MVLSVIRFLENNLGEEKDFVVIVVLNWRS